MDNLPLSVDLKRGGTFVILASQPPLQEAQLLMAALDWDGVPLDAWPSGGILLETNGVRAWLLLHTGRRVVVCWQTFRGARRVILCATAVDDAVRSITPSDWMIGELLDVTEDLVLWRLQALGPDSFRMLVGGRSPRGVAFTDSLMSVDCEASAVGFNVRPPTPLVMCERSRLLDFVPGTSGEGILAYAASSPAGDAALACADSERVVLAALHGPPGRATFGWRSMVAEDLAPCGEALLAEDGVGGCFVVWRSMLPSGPADASLRLQHVLPDGILDSRWPEFGIVPLVPHEPGPLELFSLVSRRESHECFLLIGDRLVPRLAGVRADGTLAFGWPADGITFGEPFREPDIDHVAIGPGTGPGSLRVFWSERPGGTERYQLYFASVPDDTAGARLLATPAQLLCADSDDEREVQITTGEDATLRLDWRRSVPDGFARDVVLGRLDPGTGRFDRAPTAAFRGASHRGGRLRLEFQVEGNRGVPLTAVVSQDGAESTEDPLVVNRRTGSTHLDVASPEGVHRIAFRVLASNSRGEQFPVGGLQRVDLTRPLHMSGVPTIATTPWIDVYVDGPYRGQLSWSVLDVTGRSLSSERRDKSDEVTSLRIRVPSRAGLYWVRAVGNDLHAQERFVVIR